VHGSPAACREGVERFREAGVTTPVVSILSLGEPSGPDRAVDALRGVIEALAG
jgi:hypothetical protein